MLLVCVCTKERICYEKYRRTFGECGFAAGGLTGKIAGCLGETAESREEEERRERRREERTEGSKGVWRKEGGNE
jgi:hypothetical protein